MRRRKGQPIDRETRVESGRRLRTLYLTLGMQRADVAKYLQVSERTFHNWESGRHVIPFAVYKLLRLLNHMELPGPSWDGWCFHSGKLWSPEGHGFNGTDGAWWSLLVRRAAMFGQLYAENTALRLAAKGAERLDRRGEPQADRSASRDASGRPADAGGRREAPALDLSLRHFRTQHQQMQAPRALRLVSPSTNPERKLP